jgi:hypothetical protein
MVKNIIKYIFIYTIGILLVGCDNPTSVESCDYCHLDIETNLPMYENGTWDYCEDVPIVNGSSYTLDDGYAYTMLGVYEENIGDVATIWVGYYDEYGNQWLDSIKVKIDE